MIWPFRRKSEAKKPVTARSIVIWTLVVGAIIGAIELPRPLEDIYRGGRSLIRARPADGQTVVVAIDDRSIAFLKGINYSRKFDAQVVDKLFAMGARKVAFDSTFITEIDKQGDTEFIEALKRHRGRVFLGAVVFKSESSRNDISYVPLKMFQEAAEIRSLRAMRMAFGLSEEIYYGDKTHAAEYKSLSSELSGRTGPYNTRYRPDWAIQVSTIPTVSFVDVLSGRTSSSMIANKDVVIGEAFATSNDVASVVGQGWFPGVYEHVVGAQTLREGKPVDIGWLPAFLVAAVLVVLIAGVKSKRQFWGVIGAGLVIGLAAPLILDAWFVTADFIPAYFTFAVAAYRLAAMLAMRAARMKNPGTLLPNLAALREEPLAKTRPIIAMRIRNYAAVGATFSESVENELIPEIARRLTLPGQSDIFYQAEDVLYWLGPALPKDELADHLAGLARIMETQFVINERRVDVHVAFGVDTDLQRTVASRIGRSLVAADTAASRHKLYMFNTSDNDEENAWALSLMSELDAAIENGDIWIAFQPQFELKTDQIIGAEALVRWQHPTRGAISPESFILSAEAHNRIARLTFHVLELATLAAKPLIASNPQFKLSINISGNLMEMHNLPGKIIETLAQTGFPTQNLTLEVTESAPFADDAVVGENLAGIEALGIDLSIDDYGTGNATLEYFRSIPCQEIKIDRSFVTNLLSDNGAMLLVESTIELAHGLGRRVVAEGIENPETLELLRGIGCDVAQGYYLAKPMRIEALDPLIVANKRIRAA